MKKYILISFFIISISSNSQTRQGNLLFRNIMKIDTDKLLISGFVNNIEKTTFKAILYDKTLAVLNEYEKDIPVKEKGLSYQILYGDILMVWIGGKPKGYFLKLTKDLKEISFNEKTDANVKEDIKDKNHIMLANYQLDLEGDPFGLGKGAGIFFSSRPNALTNKRFLKNDIIDFDRKTLLINRYKLNETKIDPTYTSIWRSKISDNEEIKLTAFTSVDEDKVIGCFIIKENEWKDFVSKIDSKTGKVEFLTEAKFPDQNYVFNISNAHYDQENGSLMVVGQLLFKTKGKDVFNAIGILVYDSQGNLINSKKIDFPEITLEEPHGFNFKDKQTIVHRIEKLSNGNYTISCENKVQGAPYTLEYLYSISPTSQPLVPGVNVKLVTTIGFSYYELDSKLNIVNSNLKFVENFSKKNTFINYEGFSKDGKKINFSELDKKNKTFFLMDLSSNDKSGIRQIETDTYDFRTLEKSELKKDIFTSYILENQVVIFRKPIDTYNYTLKSILIK